MFSLSKKLEYALLALGSIARHDGRLVSARHVADTAELPGALCMNLLKQMHSAGLVASERGVHGGYRLARPLDEVTLLELSELIDGPRTLVECVDGDGRLVDDHDCRVGEGCALRSPVAALQARMRCLLGDLTLADLLMPGRRIEVAEADLIGRTRRRVQRA